MTDLFVIKLGPDWMKPVGEVSILKFQPHVVVLTKILKCHKIFKFWQIAKTFITFDSPMTTIFIIKFDSDQIKIVGVVF